MYYKFDHVELRLRGEYDRKKYEDGNNNRGGFGMIAEDAKKEKDHMTERERAEFTRRGNAAVERIRKATGGGEDAVSGEDCAG